jgi:hypothetical protein
MWETIRCQRLGPPWRLGRRFVLSALPAARLRRNAVRSHRRGTFVAALRGRNGTPPNQEHYGLRGRLCFALDTAFDDPKSLVYASQSARSQELETSPEDIF